MQNEKCITCENLGVSCAGPNFLVMTSHEVIEWCKKRKKFLGMTRKKLEELSGVPMGTLNRFFDGKNSFFYFETARPIIKVLVSGAWAVDTCLATRAPVQDVPDVLLLAKIENLEAENNFLKRENSDYKSIIVEALTGKTLKMKEG